MRSRGRSTLAALVTSVVLVTAISSCAPVEPVEPVEPVTTYSARDCVDLLGVVTYDYDPVPSPSALAEQSRLVVTGMVDRVQEGRVEIVPGNENAPVGSTMVLVLRDPEAVLGDFSEGSDGFVYVELPAPPALQDADAYQDGPCTGASVVAYLTPASDGAPVEGVDIAIEDPQAGRPAGQALYIPAGPQALILQYDDEAVVWPLTGEKREGSLADTLPDGTLIAP